MRNVKNILIDYDLGLRIAFLILLVGLSFAFLLIGSKAALAMGLKPRSVVTGESILLGDVFYDLPSGADKVLGPAPQPGSEMVLNARTLLHIASALDLPWRPSSTIDQVILTSAHTTIDQAVIEDDLKTALKEKGIEGDFNVSFNAPLPAVTLPQDQPSTFEISNLTFDPKEKRFSAMLLAPSADKPIQKISLNGKVDELVEVPMLRETFRSGMIIGQRDIDMVQISRHDVGTKTATTADQLIGTTPRRSIEPNKAVILTDVEPPRIVARGDMVTMVFKEGALLLTAKGRALEHGTKGDTIRVVNSNSSRTIEGIVSGEKEVTVESY